MLNFNNPITLIITILVLTLLVVAILYVAIPFLIKKGYPVIKYLQEAETGLVQIKSTLGLVNSIAPIPYNVIIDKVLDLSAMAVNSMEQLYLKGQVDINSRKPLAVQCVNQGLAFMKIDVTPDMDKLIDLAIEGAVYVLPKTHDEPAKVSPDLAADAVKAQMINDMHGDELVSDASSVITNATTSTTSPVNIHIYTNNTPVVADKPIVDTTEVTTV